MLNLPLSVCPWVHTSVRSPIIVIMTFLSYTEISLPVTSKKRWPIFTRLTVTHLPIQLWGIWCLWSLFGQIKRQNVYLLGISTSGTQSALQFTADHLLSEKYKKSKQLSARLKQNIYCIYFNELDKIQIICQYVIYSRILFREG